MRVGFVHFFPPGMWQKTGDVTQIRETERALLKEGVSVERFDIWSEKRDYDLLHLFGNTFQLGGLAQYAKSRGIPVVFSPIAYSLRRPILSRLWGYVDGFVPVTTSWREFRKTMTAADAVLPGSDAEAVWLRRKYHVRRPMRVVYSGIDERLARAEPTEFVKVHGIRDFILEVGRICPQKGQLRLIEAVAETKHPVVFIGSEMPSEKAYCEQFHAAVRRYPWMRYLGVQSFELMASAYAAARVHVLPSLGECPGFTSLEAGLAGANVVAGESPPAREYLGEYATYCDPLSVRSIRAATTEALSRPRSDALRARLAEFSWNAVARQLVGVYRSVLAGEDVESSVPEAGEGES